MKKVILFEQFISEAANIKDTAKNILDGLDSTAQLHVDYVPKEALSTIESSLKKNKSLSGKDAAKAAKEIRMNLEEIGILSNTFSPMDVEIIIMKHLNESLVNEAKSFEMGDSFEYIPNKGSIYTITRKMAFGQKWIITSDKNTDNKFILNNAEINQWIEDGKLVPVDESIVNEAKFKVGDTWEWNHVDGVKIVTITDVKSNGDVVAKIEGESQDFIVRDANKYLKKKVNESTVNEAKELDRDALMNLLETKYKIKTVRTSEEFNGQTEGIWVAGDNGEEMSGNKIFDYYNSSAKYANGILKQVRAAVEKTGWWFEWNDPGTLIIWPKNL